MAAYNLYQAQHGPSGNGLSTEHNVVAGTDPTDTDAHADHHSTGSNTVAHQYSGGELVRANPLVFDNYTLVPDLELSRGLDADDRVRQVIISLVYLREMPY